MRQDIHCDWDAVFKIIPIVILIVCVCTLIVFILGQQQSIDKNGLCQRCGYEKATDVKYLLPYSAILIIDKLECDKGPIISLHYPSIYDKFGEESFDWNKPEAICK